MAAMDAAVCRGALWIRLGAIPAFTSGLRENPCKSTSPDVAAGKDPGDIVRDHGEVIEGKTASDNYTVHTACGRIE